MNEKKTKHKTFRIPYRLYRMIDELSVLFGSDTSVLIHILANYEHSEDHHNQLKKIMRMRFNVMFRNANLKAKFEELSDEELLEEIHKIKNKKTKLKVI